jgi:predicted alpha/beta hydrolase
MRNHLKSALDYMDKASADLDAALNHFAEALPSFSKK